MVFSVVKIDSFCHTAHHTHTHTTHIHYTTHTHTHTHTHTQSQLVRLCAATQLQGVWTDLTATLPGIANSLYTIDTSGNFVIRFPNRTTPQEVCDNSADPRTSRVSHISWFPRSTNIILALSFKTECRRKVQVSSFKVISKKLDVSQSANSLNGMYPPTVCVVLDRYIKNWIPISSSF